MDDLNAFKADLAAFVDRAKESEALVHLACRYVRNIANGRFLWRNRTVASSATVEVLLPCLLYTSTTFGWIKILCLFRLPSFSFFVNSRRFTCNTTYTF